MTDSLLALACLRADTHGQALGCLRCAKLAELVRQLQAQVQLLQAQVAQLQTEVRELRARLNIHFGNSSLPPSANPPSAPKPPPKAPTGRKPGGQPDSVRGDERGRP